MTRWRPRPSWAAVALLVGLSWLAAGCGGEDGGATPGDPADALAVDATSVDVSPRLDAARDVTPGDDGSVDPGDGPLPPDPVDVSADAAATDAADVPADLGPPIPSDVPAGVLTVAGLPAAWNGSQPLPPTAEGGPDRPFRWRANRHDTTLDLLQMEDDPALDPATAALRCGPWAPAAPPEAPGVADPTPPGAPPGPVVALRWRVAADNPLPDGDSECALVATSLDGRAEHRAAFGVTAADMPPALDPFAAIDTWLITFDRDLHAITLVDGDGGVELRAVVGANGQPDLVEAMMAVGFLGADEAFNAALLGRWRTNFMTQLRGIFGLGPGGERGPDSARVRFATAGEPGAPDPASFDPAGPFSILGIGGDGTPAQQADRAVGVADLDWNNQVANDNGGLGRGVFVSQILRLALSIGASANLMAKTRPGVGVPLGEFAGDADLLDAAPRPGVRGLIVTLVLDYLSLGAAATAAHEMGHSLGLVPAGLPPDGIFAEVPDVPFLVQTTTTFHLDAPGLNVMQIGRDLDLNEFAGGLPAFAPGPRAYLLRRVIVGPLP